MMAMPVTSLHEACRWSRHCSDAHFKHPQQAPGRRRSTVLHAVGRTAYSVETRRLVKCLLTRQAIKTALNYLSETNGELHFWLHNYVSANPLPLSGSVDADDWLAELASTPLTSVEDPRRSSVPSAAAAAAVSDGTREVSPREVAERIIALRSHVAMEVKEDLELLPRDNDAVRRRALQRSVGDVKGLQ